jgi:hypothetical protein
MGHVTNGRFDAWLKKQQKSLDFYENQFGSVKNWTWYCRKMISICFFMVN